MCAQNYTQWYYSVDGESFGPVSEEHLIQFARAGYFTKHDFVYPVHIGEWVSADRVQGLFEDARGLAQAYRMKEDIEGRVTAQSEKADEAHEQDEQKNNDTVTSEEWHAFQTEMGMLALTGAVSVSQFERLLQGAPDWQRQCIARALGAVKPAKKPVVRCLEGLLTDTNDHVREVACDALGKIGGEAVYPSVTAAQLGSLGLVRVRRKVGVSGIRHVCKTLLKLALSDKSETVREAAKRAIARIDDSRA